jgi:hypothetical protein
MLFSGVALLLVLIMMSYLASQGTLTALLGLVSAGFASLVAMAYFETFQHFMAGWKPDYARGVTFLVLFLVTYFICKIISDVAIPRNIRLPKAVDRGVGAVIGFFAGLLTVGTTVLGIEMLPLKTTVLGYDRYEGSARMESSTPGTPSEGKNVWLSPEGFTMGFWNLASGRGLGGSRPFASIHPNLADEAYGYRNVVQYGQLQTLNNGLKVSAAQLVTSAHPDEMKRLHIQDGKEGLLVRCEISGGTDIDAYFRVTATAVRLVTSANKQYYPIGYLDAGRRFVATPLANGHTADDEPGGNPAIEEWVFQFDKGERPTTLEIKGLSRVDLAQVDISEKPLTPLAVTQYPHKEYRQNEGAVALTLTNGGQPLPNVPILLLRGATRRDLSPVLPTAYNRTKEVLQQFTDGQGGWHDPPSNNEHFPKETFANAQRMMREPAGSALDTPIFLRDQLPHMYIANTGPSPLSTPGLLQTYTDNVMIPTLRNGENTVIAEGVTDAAGKVNFAGVPKGTWVAFAATKVDNKFYMWCANVEVKPKETTNRSLDSSKADFKFPPNFGGGGSDPVAPAAP